MKNKDIMDIEEIRRLAEQGNPDAQYYLGRCYNDGTGVERDYRKAYDLYVESALQGNEMAKNDLAILYYIEKPEGLEDCDPTMDADVNYGDIKYGLGQALIKARDKRADAGNVDSQYARGLDYYEGRYCDQDYVKALEWLTKAAEQGHDRAQCLVGQIYLNGFGTEKDFDKARKWLTLSSEQGVAEAQFILSVIYYLGKGVDADWKEAFRWALRSAEQDYDKAQYMVAKMYSGEGDEVDWTKAAYWYGKAAGNGEIHSMYMYGVCLEKGQGVERNMEEAMKWYDSAAENGVEEAKRRIGRSSEEKRKTKGLSGFAIRTRRSQIKLIMKVLLVMLGIDVILFLISLAAGNYEGCVVSFVTFAVLFCMLVYYLISYYEKKR